jgi:hypothetical protein
MAAPVRLISYDPFALLADERGLPRGDARVVQFLGRMVQLAAVLSDAGDARAHAALRTLEGRIGWQHALVGTRERIGRDGATRAGTWLHLTADPRQDGALERAAGAALVCMPRAGIADPLALQQAADAGELVIVSDFWQLADAVARRNGAPVRYVVQATLLKPDVLPRYLHWMRYEHGPELLAQAGCQSFEVLAGGEREAEAVYYFQNQAALDAYLAGPAAELRQKAAEQFGADEIEFARSVRHSAGGYAS